MSHSLHIVLRCNAKDCKAWMIGLSGTSVPDTRAEAAKKGWKFKPGNPYPHVGGTDLCPTCAKGS